MLQVLVFFIVMAFSSVAYSGEFYANLGLGASLFQRTTQNGTWFQEGQPYNMQLLDIAGKLGVGYRIDPNWAVEVNAISFGQAKSAGLAVPDEYYNPSAHKPIPGAPKPNHFDARQRSYGMEVVAIRYFPIDDWAPFLKAGAFAAYNDMPYTILSQPDMTEFNESYKGYTVGASVGGGICWKMVCGEGTYHRGLGSSQYPISKSPFVPMLTVKIPF